MPKLVSLKSVSKYFDNKPILKNVSFDLNKGQITTLIGQNGTGKTTIAKIILGLEEISSGEVSLFNSKMTSSINSQIKIGYVPQKLDLNSTMPISALQLMESVAENKVFIEDPELQKFIPNLSKLENKDISELSGGQLQKIILLGTILRKPELLILDEPTQFLDVVSQQKFYHLIEHLKKNYNMTIFMISHDLFTVMKNSDQVICLNQHVCCSGKPTEINQNSDFKNALSEIGVYIHNHDHTH
ncbi:MAG: hypothetical protein DGJ47_000027 [Rickettsiaceae bacterium]